VLRVPGEVVDRFIAQIGEMVTVGNMLDLTIKDSELGAALQILRRAVQGSSGNGAGGGEGADVAASLDKVEKAFQRLALADQQLHSVLGRLQENAMELRVVPIDTVFSRFPRVVRDLAQAHNKQIRLDMDGGEVRIDKGMVEVLVEPLMHMVRNSVDHAIESPEERAIAGKPPVARIGLRAVQQGNRVVVEIQDDGRGLNVQKIRTKAVERGIVSEAESRAMTDDQICHFIFAPGFSTADKVTETSGRGVGMDVVLTNMTRLGGNIDIRTRLGEGTTFSLQLPLSAAIQTALMVEAGGQLLAIPERHLAEIHDTTDSIYQTVRGQRAILLRNSFLPLFRLQDLLGHRSASERAGAQANDNTNATVRRPVVVLANGRKHIGIEVDRLLRRQDLFVKEIHPKLAAIPGVGGASILGDGRVVLILDGEDLFRLAERSGPAVPLHV
jgi:chemotaxis protein histidine kinase CheA